MRAASMSGQLGPKPNGQAADARTRPRWRAKLLFRSRGAHERVCCLTRADVT